MLAHRLYGYCMRKPHCCCGLDPEETGWGGTEGCGKFTKKISHLNYCSMGSVVCFPAPFCHAPWRPAQNTAAPTHKNCLLLSSPHSCALRPSHWCFSCLRKSKIHQIISNKTALHSTRFVYSKLVFVLVPAPKWELMLSDTSWVSSPLCPQLPSSADVTSICRFDQVLTRKTNINCLYCTTDFAGHFRLGY